MRLLTASIHDLARRSPMLAVGFVVALIAGCHQTTSNANDVALPSLKNHYRVMASFTDSAKRARTLVNAFRSAPDLGQRDIVWVVVGPERIVSSLDAAAVPPRDRLERLHTVHGFQTVLIGKDGTLRASQLGGLNIQALLDALDPLPSRLQAMTQ